MSEPTAPQQAGIRELIREAIRSIDVNDCDTFNDMLDRRVDAVVAALASATDAEVQGLLDTHKRAVVRFEIGKADYEEVTAAESQIKALITATRRAGAVTAIDDATVERAFQQMQRWLPLGAVISAPTVNGMGTGPESEYGQSVAKAMKEDLLRVLALATPPRLIDADAVLAEIDQRLEPCSALSAWDEVYNTGYDAALTNIRDHIAALVDGTEARNGE
jgi:hypothetical protein